jgi:hypothetical protein
MRRIELSSWKDVPKRVESAKRSFEIVYGVKLAVDQIDVPVDQLFPTEDFLENDKLALVFRAVVTQGYDAPIISVEREDDYFVVDGHHRAFVSRKLRRETIKANVLKFPEGTSYRDVPKHPFDGLPVKEVANIDDLTLKAWERILTILKHYEALYNVYFYLREEHIKLRELSPTQSLVMKKQIDPIKKLLVPIACIEHGGKYYILDGHARSLRATQLGLNSIWAMILSPKTPIDFGIVKTAKEMNLKSLKDINIIDK